MTAVGRSERQAHLVRHTPRYDVRTIFGREVELAILVVREESIRDGDGGENGSVGGDVVDGGAVLVRDEEGAVREEGETLSVDGQSVVAVLDFGEDGEAFRGGTDVDGVLRAEKGQHSLVQAEENEKQGSVQGQR